MRGRNLLFVERQDKTALSPFQHSNTHARLAADKLVIQLASESGRSVDLL